MGKILRGIFLVVIIFIVIAIIIAVLDNPMQKWEDFDNAELKSNIEKAFEEINLNSSGIERIAQIDDWANGPRYKITYNNDIYYVNRSGIVRYKNDFYRINKKSFSHIMNQDKSKCPLID